MNMPKDYEVFEPNNEHLAQIIVRILEERGYNAGYQLGYPNNKIFINVDTKEEADRISGIIRRFMEKFSLTERGITTYKLNTLISKLSSLIPETPKRKREKPAEHIEKKIENKDYGNSKISESEVYHNAKLEEWRSTIVERLNLLSRERKENPNDPLNEQRQIESNILVWVLSVMPK
jgi:hypothetical protein